MKLLRYGVFGFAEARAIQDRLVKERIAGECEDSLIVCEHPPTLSLGKRVQKDDALYLPARWKSRGIEVVTTERGGEATFHAEGQLVLYPVIHLSGRRFGVRKFVERGLEAIADVCRDEGLSAEARLDPAGVWISGSDKKLASVGLRIERGVSNHGFSFNINCELEAFSEIPLCGRSETRATSVERELEAIAVGGSLQEVNGLGAMDLALLEFGPPQRSTNQSSEAGSRIRALESFTEPLSRLHCDVAPKNRFEQIREKAIQRFVGEIA